VSGLVDQPKARLLRRGLEHGCEWLTADSDFQRFKGLRVRHPLA
jgi:hypothetical protein